MGSKQKPNTKETRLIVAKLKDADKKLYDIKTDIGIKDREIRNLRNKINEEQIEKKLSQIPVESLNSNGEGIRVSSLKAAGFDFVDKIEKMSIDDLTGIDGVGEAQAQKIKTKCYAIKNNFSKSVVLDSGEEQSKQLIFALYKRLKIRDIEQQITKLLQYHNQIFEYSKGLEIVSPIRFLFASKSRKELARSSYDKLREIYNSSYIDDVENLTVQYDETMRNLVFDDAIDEYNLNTAPFFALLLKICGEGSANQADELSELPKEVLVQINAVEIDVSLMNATLRSYQEFGVKYAINQAQTLLGDEMGLGKTIQAIAFMAHYAACGQKYFLVVCPVSVLTNWKREISTHSKLVPKEIYGDDREEEYTSWLEEGGVAVTTYETLSKIDLDKMVEGMLDVLVVDEAHYVKNPEARRTIALHKVADKSKKSLFMTGTPLENKVDEMVFLISIIRPELASKLNNMKEISNAQEFKQTVSSVYLRRVREDVLTELPEKTEIKEWCRLSDIEKDKYKKSLITKNITEMRKVSYNVENFEDSSKIRRILELCEEAASEGRKIVIFSFFLDIIEKVKLALGEKCYAVITGAVASDKRQRIIDDFAKAPSGSVLISQIMAGGVGLNIQCASVVIICEPQWKPSVENQAISRCYRMGQANTVLVYRMLALKTVDEKILKLLDEKNNIFEKFADESEIENVNKSILNDIIEEERAEYGINDIKQEG